MKPSLIHTGGLSSASWWNRRIHPSRLGQLLLLCVAAGALAAAQTTTISGNVFDPRTTSDSLPLPNVLVYATTSSSVAPLPSGVQCLTYAAPQGVVSYTYTAVDGSFTLDKIPPNTSYTVVIQAGKWRRVFSETVGAGALTGLALHMPSDHTQGDIPMIAISTGSVDGVECVLRDMGIADTEFTDDNGSINPGGHIHLYQGNGAYVSANPPRQAALTDTAATLNNYDMVMFPCWGSPSAQDTTALKNIVAYANAGGRIFTTHYSYDWLVPDAPYDSPFPPVADWTTEAPSPNGGVATVNTAFTDGTTLAQWLQNAGATYQNQPDQIVVDTVRHDLKDVIPPTQSWLTLNDPTDGNPVLQLTFNTPVGAPAANQCGRVLFNEYHVFNLAQQADQFPNECPPKGLMTPQEEMLEYALFDLSAFVQPVVVPTLQLDFNPSPLSVKPGTTGYQVTINGTNTSTNTAIDSSAVLTIALPPLLTATAIADSTNGWQCTLGTLTCTRTSSIGAGASDSLTLTLNVATYPASGPPASGAVITATVSSPTFSNNVTATDQVIYKQPPAIVWPPPAPIVYGTPLGATQLDATATVAGSFSYTPAAGTVLAVGQHTLTANFTPSDTTNYIPSTATVTLTVVPASPTVGLTASPNPSFISNPITFTASVPSPAGAPTGTVAFYDGSTQLGSSALASGSGSMSTSSLGLGRHLITAAYSGDSNFQAATSAVLPITLEDFSIAAQGSSAGAVTVYPGHSATYTFVVTPIGGPTLPQALNLVANDLPDDASYSFSPATIAANSPATTVTLTVTPKSLSAATPPRGATPNRIWPMALGILLLPFAGLRKRAGWMRLLIVVLSAAALALGVNACGGVTYTPRSFSMTVTANSGALAHSTSVQITVE